MTFQNGKFGVDIGDVVVNLEENPVGIAGVFLGDICRREMNKTPNIAPTKNKAIAVIFYFDFSINVVQSFYSYRPVCRPGRNLPLVTFLATLLKNHIDTKDALLQHELAGSIIQPAFVFSESVSPWDSVSLPAWKHSIQSNWYNLSFNINVDV